LELSLSAERLGPYYRHCGGDRKQAVRCYEWNVGVSESLWGVLQGLEIALRNAIHRELTFSFGQAEWYDCARLQPFHAQQIGEAKRRIVRSGKQLTAGRVVAEMSLGFWVSLLGPAYAQVFWDKHLHQAFRQRIGRKTVHARLNGIRKLRNRVAHHESIVARNLKDDFALIVETIHWICPTTARWVKCTSSFHERFGQKPKL
jgi:hypothetical protein